MLMKIKTLLSVSCFGVFILVGGVILLGCGATESSAIDENNLINVSSMIPADPTAENECTNCYVRCTAADPDACRWTSARNRGYSNDCTGKGKEWCRAQGYKHTWAGCSPKLHYKNCP